MSQQLIEKVFEPFQSQFEGGTGLGLAIVYQIVQAHEGKVWARSKLGQGSVFVLRLRRFAAAVASPQVSPAQQLESRLPDTAAAAVGGGARG
jgi:signal transduction histidine kinase